MTLGRLSQHQYPTMHRGALLWVEIVADSMCNVEIVSRGDLEANIMIKIVRVKTCPSWEQESLLSRYSRDGTHSFLCAPRRHKCTRGWSIDSSLRSH